MILPFLSPLQIEYMNTPFQIGPQQEAFIKEREEFTGSEHNLKISPHDVGMKQKGMDQYIHLLCNHMSIPEAAAAIMANPSQFFSFSV